MKWYARGGGKGGGKGWGKGVGERGSSENTSWILCFSSQAMESQFYFVLKVRFNLFWDDL